MNAKELKKVLSIEKGCGKMGVLVMPEIGEYRIVIDNGSLTVRDKTVKETEAKEVKSAFVNAKELVDTISRLDGEIIIEITDEKTLSVRDAETTVKIHAHTEPKPPTMPKDIIDTIVIPLDETLLLEALDKVEYAAYAKKETKRPELASILLEIGNGNFRLVSCDGHRLALAECAIAETTPAMRHVISSNVWTLFRKTIAALGKNNHFTIAIGRPNYYPFDSPELAAMKAIKITVETDTIRVIIFSKIVDLTYPDYERLLLDAERQKQLIQVNAMEATKVITKALKFTEKFSCKLKFAPNCKAINVSTEKCNIALPGEFTEFPEFYVNGKYVLDVLRRINGMANISLGDANNPIVIAPARTEMVRVYNLIMPLVMEIASPSAVVDEVLEPF